MAGGTETRLERTFGFRETLTIGVETRLARKNESDRYISRLRQRKPFHKQRGTKSLWHRESQLSRAVG